MLAPTFEGCCLPLVREEEDDRFDLSIILGGVFKTHDFLVCFK
jgi:hypothetical protein